MCKYLYFWLVSYHFAKLNGEPYSDRADPNLWWKMEDIEKEAYWSVCDVALSEEELWRCIKRGVNAICKASR